jgi:hypothetical protein
VFVDFLIGSLRWIRVGCRKLIDLEIDIMKVLRRSLAMHVVTQMDMIGLSVHVVVARIDIISI